MYKPILKVFILGAAVYLAALFLMSCVSRRPEVKAEPEPKILIPPAPRISLKTYHLSMRDGMQKSFESADEVILGVFTGNFADGPKGRSFYFDQFRIFSKETWAWGPETNILLPVLFQEINPEIIPSQELESLLELDKTGICWDEYEGPRVIYLVEGIPNLLFLKQSFDEATNDLHRVLIDTYPLTEECRAKDIFDLMLRDRAKNLKIKNPDAFVE